MEEELEKLKKQLKFYHEFEENLQIMVDGNSDLIQIGEFVMEYFDYWK